MLAEELGTPPEAETTTLYLQIQSGMLAKAAREPGARVAGDVATKQLQLPHNLPPAPPLLVGRTEALADIVHRLRQGETRLLTLMGPGGMGKTCLAVEAGRALLPAFADGVFFVSLAGLSMPGAVPAAIAAALGLPLQLGDPRTALLQTLQQKQLLLILDNFEHLLPDENPGGDLAVDLVVELLGMPRVQILVTSRVRLELLSEHVYHVEGLDYSRHAILAAAAATPAVHLFVHCVQRIQAGFQLTPANLTAVLRICELVQGMPLGLELAAAWCDTLPLTAIAAEIERSIDFLAVDYRDLPQRQRSMRAVFEWSWNLLNGAERQVLRRLTIFRGGFTRAAAAQIAGASLRSLTGLVHKSLLRRTDGDSPLAGRYELHELLRQYASEQLDAVPVERAAVAARHGEYYLAFVAAREYRLTRHEPRAAAEELRAELDNIRQAWHWAAVEADVAVLDRAAYGWWQFCLLTGLTAEGEQTFGLAAAHVRARLEQAAEQDPLRLPAQRLLSKLLAFHANYLFAQGKDELMAAEARAAISLGEASGGLEGETFGCFVLGRALQELKQHAASRAMWEKTIQLARDYGARQPASELLREVEFLGQVWLRGALLFFGEYLAAQACDLQTLRLCRALGKVRGEMVCLANLAESHFLLGDYATARQGYEQALALAQALGFPYGEAETQRKLGDLLRMQGEYAQAQALLEQAVATARTSGFLYDEALALAALVRLHSQVGNSDGARTCAGQLRLRMAERELTQDCQAQGLLALAIHALYREDYQQALADAHQGWQFAAQADNTNNRADAAVVFGHACAAAHQWAEAAQAYRQAITIYQQLGSTPLLVEPQAGLAQVLLVQRQPAQAQLLVEAILPLLAAPPFGRVHTPMYTYLTCYHVLAANLDEHAAPLIAAAHTLLQEYAAHIHDDSLRSSFLEQVAIHRQLQQLHHELAPPAISPAGQ